MNEISREKAIIAIKKHYERYTSSDGIFDEALEQAISDMQKLEKIEKIVNNSTFHPNNYMASVELLGIIKEIEQIVKEVE